MTEGATPTAAPLTRRGDGALSLEVHVKPRSSRERVLGIRDGRLEIALTSPPVDGEANAALVALLARTLGVPRANVRIEHGEQGRRKLLRIEGATLADAAARLGITAG